MNAQTYSNYLKMYNLAIKGPELSSRNYMKCVRALTGLNHTSIY